jgi:citrate lyase subunit beta/citryl-CoA lyase
VEALRNNPSPRGRSHDQARRQAPLYRSFLYAPGSDDRILKKALTAGADAVVLDLEDSVAATDKARARDSVAALIDAEASAAVCDVHVRINRDRDSFSESDLRAIVRPGLTALRLPKCESATSVAKLASLLAEVEHQNGVAVGSTWLYPTIESATGVLHARELARATERVAALVFGPADFLGDLGVAGASGWEAALTARSTLVLESRAAGIGKPIDGAFIDLSDTTGLRQHSERVRDLGFFGKSAIHPSQLPVINDVFTPSPETVDHARRVVSSLSDGNATAVVDGQFVDPAVAVQAHAVLVLADRTTGKGAKR